MSVELEKMNPDKMIRLILNQSAKNSKANIIEEKVLTKEDLKKRYPELEETIRDLNKIAESDPTLNRRVRLSVNKDIDRIIISIVDRNTDRVIKEIPCKELQDLAVHLKKAIGILYDNNA
jgi:flagellar protein FlaG